MANVFLKWSADKKLFDEKLIWQEQIFIRNK